MTDEVIAHLNSLSVDRKINKTSNYKQPIFEQNKRLISDDDDQYYNENDTHDIVDNIEPAMIHPYELPYDNEDVEHDLENEFDVPDKIRDEIPGYYESDDIVDQLLEEIDNDTVNDFTEYDNDDTPVNNQALLDDIFGIDSDDEVDVHDVNNVTAESTADLVPNVEPVLRRSDRNHALGKWNKKYVSVNTFQREMSLRTFVLNMTVSESISKFGDTAVDSIDKEMRQMFDKDVWEGVMLNSLTLSD